MTDRDQGEPAANGLGMVRTRKPRRTAGPRRVALLIPAAALLVLMSGAASSFRWMFVPALVLGLAGGIWLIVTVPGLLPHGAVSRLMMTLLAVPAVAAGVLSAIASQGYVLETRGEVRSGEVARVIEHHGKTTSYECVIHYRAVPKAPGSLNCGRSDHVGDTVRVAWDPGGLVEPDFAEAKGTYRFFATLAMVSEIALVILGELTVAIGVVIRAAHRVSAARGPGTEDGPDAADGW